MEQFKFYVDGKGFKTYQEARIYADELLVSENKFRCIFTEDEMNSVNYFIDNQGNERV